MLGSCGRSLARITQALAGLALVAGRRRGWAAGPSEPTARTMVRRGRGAWALGVPRALWSRSRPPGAPWESPAAKMGLEPGPWWTQSPPSLPPSLSNVSCAHAVDAEPGPCRDPSALDERSPQSRGSRAGDSIQHAQTYPTVPLGNQQSLPGPSCLEMGDLGHSRPAGSLGPCLGAGAWNPPLLKAAPKHRHQGFLCVCVGQPKPNASDVACEPHLF